MENNIENLEIFLQKIPEKYDILKGKIEDKTIQRLYSLFFFQSLIFPNANGENEIAKKNEIKDFLIKELQNYYFITINMFNINFSKEKSDENINNYDKTQNIKYYIVDLAICVENKCMIIEKINYSIIIDTIYYLKNKGHSIINVSTENISYNNSLEEDHAEIEISNFCLEFINEIENNEFVKNTIRSISGYMIRRYFYPTKYFKDPTFFDFDKMRRTERLVKSEFFGLIENYSIDQKEYSQIKDKVDDINSKNNCKEFHIKEFIFLRIVNNNSIATFHLAFHIESFYIFMIKEMHNIEEETRNFYHEKKFCKNYFHRCFTHFYGFLISQEKKITGFIYEYMSNSSLQYYALNNPSKINCLFSMITINRILSGIEYIHSNSLIHRDIKPSNILIDHDFIPYISDFETICQPNADMTMDFGTLGYASPEQLEGKKICYSTDIYSFGQIIYFLYELNHPILNKENKIKYISNAPKGINEIYKGCIKINPKSRLTVEQIKIIFYNVLIEINLFELDVLLLDESQMIQYIYEAFLSQRSDTEKKMYFLFKTFVQAKINDKSILLSLADKFLDQYYLEPLKYDQLFSNQSNIDIMYTIGIIYYDGIYIEHNYQKAKEYFVISAKQNNYDAIKYLGILYFYGYGVEQDYLKAKEYFEIAVKHGKYDALEYLGHFYFYGYGVEKNYLKAKEYYELAKKQNNFRVIEYLGHFYFYGYGVEKNYSKAKEYYEMAVENCNHNAYLYLGHLYFYGYGTEKNYPKAIEYYEMSAKESNSEALYILGNCYFYGYGVKKNHSKAIEYYELSAKKNNSNALNSLGDCYSSGNGVELNYTKSIKYYELSAKQNNSNALYSLGDLFLNGCGVKKDYVKAKKYFESSAKLNNSHALNNLGFIYGKGYGVKQNYHKAIEYFEMSAKLNNSNAIFNLGSFYLNGLGVKQNYDKAIEYYETSAKYNNPSAISKLGFLYLNGIGVKQNYNKAIEYLELASKLNNSNSLNILGTIYHQGEGVKQNYFKAKEYYELAAKLNDPQAIVNLGNLYAKGHGVKQNYQIAKEYYEFAAALDESMGFYNIGFLYKKGYGVKRDYIKAKEYYELAAQQNNSDALYSLGLLYADGYGVEKNNEKTKMYFELAAKQNDSHILIKLGIHYANGYGVEQNYEKSKMYFELAANKDKSTAFTLLGDVHFYGIGIGRNYDKAIEYYELAIKENSPKAFMNLGNIYYYGYGVKKDFLKAKKYYEKLIDINDNSFAYVKIGNLYLKGKEVEKNYSKAIEYYELAASKNNSIALYKLGKLYYKGLGVKQDYLKAKKYFELSTCSKAFFKLGHFYLHGIGIQKNYNKACQYYELSGINKNPKAYYVLGDLYSSGNIIKIDIQKSLQYFMKSVKTHYKEKTILTNDNYYSNIRIYNQFYYHTNNDIGLIYITVFNDFKKANEYIKEAAFGEYPFGQNNFGILNEIYLNKIENAEYFYKKSSMHNFAPAEFNLGHLKEKLNEIKESIEYFKKASEDEDVPLVFHNHQHYDKRLEISKTFIICLTNLKLSEYYLSQSNISESKKHFIKVFSKLKINTESIKYIFKPMMKNDKIESIFVHIKCFILNYPLFNLIHQPNLDSKIINQIKSNNWFKNQIQQTNDNDNYDINKTAYIDNMSKQIIYLNSQKCTNQIKKDEIESKKFSEFCVTNINNDIKTNKNEIVFDDSGELFNFIISNENYKNIFISEIRKIIHLMEEIIYTPPYLILFGRINIENKDLNENDDTNPHKMDINEMFYEGFEFGD